MKLSQTSKKKKKITVPETDGKMIQNATAQGCKNKSSWETQVKPHPQYSLKVSSWKVEVKRQAETANVRPSAIHEFKHSAANGKSCF